MRVIIADDEERICKLISVLIDWESLDMEIIGMASNGIEAIEMVDSLQPDILITDIRMPGCDGLELIKKVKNKYPSIEIIIISGYAHFDYAQTAIRFGVGDYLLKPINKDELTQTINKLHEKILLRNKKESDIQKLKKNSELDMQRLKKELVNNLVTLDDFKPDIEMLKNKYLLQVNEGIFQGFCMKLDYDYEKISQSALRVINGKIEDIINGKSLKKMCHEIVFVVDHEMGYGILNYQPKNEPDIRRILKDYVNQLVMQRSILGPVEFTLALGNTVKDCSKLSESIKNSQLLIQERIITGTQRVIEKMPAYSGLKDVNLLEKYSRSMLKSIEMLSIEAAKATTDDIKDIVLNMKNIRGYEIFDLIISAGNLFLMQVEYKDRNARFDIFRKKCNQCSNVQGLFECLDELHCEVIETLKQTREDERIRPVRLAKQYIQNHYNEQITLEEVSDVVGLSSGYFSVLFKKENSEGFAKYLINVRMEQAKILLRETNVSVSDICKKVGYNDLKHFIHTFDKITGVKPTVYRKLYG